MENKVSIFSSSLDDSITCYSTESFDIDSKISFKPYSYIITKKVGNWVKQNLSDIIICVPKLEDKFVEEYIKSTMPRIPSPNLFAKSRNNDMWAITNEEFKYNGIENKIGLYEELIKDGQYDIKDDSKTFDLINSLMQRNGKNAIIALNSMLDNSNVFGVLTLLYNKIKQIIDIQIGKQSFESIGISENQYKAIKYYNCGYYTAEQLEKIFQFICGIDKQIKSGELDTSVTIDYIVVKLMSNCY